MREPLGVRRYEPRDLDGMAALLAAAHRRARAAEPELPAAFEDVAACIALLTEALLGRNADIAVADRGGRLAGFLAGTRSMVAPDAFFAQYGPMRGISMPVAGHALAEGEPPVEAYRALYGLLSGIWAEDGFFVHHAGVRAGDRAAIDAWFLLGFGANAVFAGRDLEGIAALDARAVGVEVREATHADLAVVRRMDEYESLFHREPPVFWPHLGRDVTVAVEQFQRMALDNPRQRIFLAFDRDEPVGMNFLLGERGFGPRLAMPDDGVYLYQAIVAPDARGAGIGTALLRHSAAWALGEGYRRVALHYAAMNPLGAPFWQRHGFAPLEITVERHVDERVAWARER